MDFSEAAARNEELFRGVNERIDQGAEKHHVEARLPFHCECSDASCVETLSISPHDYEAVVDRRYCFVVIAGHETAGIEVVVERHDEYLVVEKIGAAREQIDRDHPQVRHRDRGGAQ